MTNIRIFAIEDDPVFLTGLERMIEECGYALAGSAGRPEPLLNRLEQDAGSIDLVLMDINIRGSLNGIELAKKVKEYGVPVIFLSGYEDPQTYQAAQEASPFGYLVKPVRKITLQSAIDSAILRFGEPSLAAEAFRLWQENELLNDALFVKVGDRYIKVFISDIHFVEAEGNYIIIHTRENRYAVKMSLKQFKHRLSARRFIQVHRRYLVQLTRIDSVNLSASELETAGRKLSIGASYKSELMDRLNKL